MKPINFSVISDMEPNNFSTALQQEYLDIENAPDTKFEPVLVPGLAKKLYETYCNHTNWKSLVSGADLPQWEGLQQEIKDAWGACAEYVIREGV